MCELSTHLNYKDIFNREWIQTILCAIIINGWNKTLFENIQWNLYNKDTNGTTVNSPVQ